MSERGLLIMARAICLVLATALSCCANATAADRTITVSVSVKNPDQTPVAAVGIEVSGGAEPFFGATASNGTVTATVVLPDAATEVTVGMRPAPAPGGGSPTQTERTAFEAMLVGKCLPRSQKVAINSTTTSYAVTFQLREAVTLQAHLVGGTVSKDEILVAVLGTSWNAQIDDSTAVAQTDQIAKGQAGEIAIVNARTGAVKVVPFTAQQAGAAINLGDVTVPNGTTGETVTMTATHLDTWPRIGTADYAAKSIVMMKSDGELVRTYFILGDGRVCADRLSCGTLKLPSGVYYLCPGSRMDEWTVQQMRAKFAQAGTAGLQAASIPSVTVTDSGTNTFTIDMQAALNACKALRNP